VTLDDIEAILKSPDPADEAKRLPIVRAIGMYSVALFAVKGAGESEVLTLAGSGTLVQISGVHYILTARHVWEEVLKTADKLGVTLRENVDHSHLIDVSAIVPIGPESIHPWTENGPDIVLLRIPEDYVGAIKAFKVFYNLSIGEPSAPQTSHLETWFVIGVPGCTGTFTPKHASIEHLGAEVGLLSSGINGNSIRVM
jgi:hypothetical protein